MNRERMQKLLDLKIMPDEFSVGTYRHDTPDCGTSACYIGHYIMAYPNEGLELRPLPIRAADGGREFYLRGHGCLSYEAIGKHFQISEPDARLLFGGLQDRRVSPLKQIEAIRADIRSFMAENEHKPT